MALLTEKDHNQMDKYLGRVLDAYKAGRIDRIAAVSEIAHVIAAVDGQNITEARSHFVDFKD
jgi:O-phosphoseryl-tRNA(Cys) synthetase